MQKQNACKGNMGDTSSYSFHLLSQRVSFRDYLLANKYIQLSKRLFMKDSPLELIRLSKKDGQTTFRNFAEPRDKGNLMDFIQNRSHEEGKVFLNKSESAKQTAIEKVRDFIEKGSKVIKLQPRMSRVLTEDQPLVKGITR